MARLGGFGQEKKTIKSTMTQKVKAGEKKTQKEKNWVGGEKLLAEKVRKKRKTKVTNRKGDWAGT